MGFIGFVKKKLEEPERRRQAQKEYETTITQSEKFKQFEARKTEEALKKKRSQEIAEKYKYKPQSQASGGNIFDTIARQGQLSVAKEQGFGAHLPALLQEDIGWGVKKKKA